VGEGSGEQEGVVMVVLMDDDVVDVESPEHAENAEEAEPERRSRVLLEPRRANMSLNPEALGVALSSV
jgi:hypothetical protein